MSKCRPVCRLGSSSSSRAEEVWGGGAKEKRVVTRGVGGCGTRCGICRREWRSKAPHQDGTRKKREMVNGSSGRRARAQYDASSKRLLRLLRPCGSHHRGGTSIGVCCGYETPQNAFRRATRSGASTIVALRGVIFLAARTCPPHRPTSGPRGRAGLITLWSG